MKLPDRKRLAYIGIIALLLLGIGFRMLFMIQNRALFIDESNVARNLHEKSYTEFVEPLDYEQYAPPVFLCTTKVAAELFGYSEWALRLVPFIAGVLSLFFFVLVARRYMTDACLLYPLSILAGALIFLKYSTELKQYSTDLLIVLALIWLAGRNKQNYNSPGFILLWILVGTLAIWSSMTSVFILACIGMYWFITILQARKWHQIAGFCFIGMFWLAQFGGYYWFILKDQVGSNYLQDFHASYFLSWPVSLANIQQNFTLLLKTLGATCGEHLLIMTVNGLLLVVGFLYLFLKDRKALILIAGPILLTLIASLLKQYSLFPRLTLFLQPLLLILIGSGVGFIASKLPKTGKWTMVSLLIVIGFFQQSFRYISQRYELQEIKYALTELVDKQSDSEELWLHSGANPAFQYYTTIHPDHQQWQHLEVTQYLDGDDNFDELMRAKPKGTKVWVLFTSIYSENRKNMMQDLGVAADMIYEKEENGCYLYLYKRR